MNPEQEGRRAEPPGAKRGGSGRTPTGRVHITGDQAFRMSDSAVLSAPVVLCRAAQW